MKVMAWLVIALVCLAVPVGTTVGIGITEGWHNGAMAGLLWIGCIVIVALMIWALTWAVDRI